MPVIRDRVVTTCVGDARVWTGGHGPTLLLLHGGCGDAAVHWERVWTSLADHFTIVAPDLPGFGASPAITPSSFANLVTFASDLLKSLGADGPTTVVGNSFGGALARLLAANHPEQVGALVLADGGLIPRIPLWTAPLIAASGLNPVFDLIRGIAYSPRGLERMVANPATLTAELRTRMAADAEAFVASMRQTALESVPALDVPTQPTLILWGAEDHLTPPRVARTVNQQIPGSRVVVMIGAGHMPMLERSAAFVREIVAFAGANADDA